MREGDGGDDRSPGRKTEARRNDRKLGRLLGLALRQKSLGEADRAVAVRPGQVGTRAADVDLATPLPVRGKE